MGFCVEILSVEFVEICFGFDEFNAMVYKPVLGFNGSEIMMVLFFRMWA